MLLYKVKLDTTVVLSGRMQGSLFEKKVSRCTVS